MKIYDKKEKRELSQDDPMIGDWEMIMMINPKILDEKNSNGGRN